MSFPPKTGSAILNHSLSFKTSMVYRLASYALYVLNIVMRHSYSLVRRIRKPVEGPDLIKTYPCRPKLKVHIFYPPQYDASAPQKTKLPVLFTIHGGGYVVGNPEDADPWNYHFVRRSRAPVLVVSLDYSKAPVAPFPRAIHDLEALIFAVLADTSLPVDPDRVAVAGWSAGGNLSLAVASLPSMRGDPKAGRPPRIHAVVPIYPAVDFTTRASEKAQTRRYKPELQGFRGRNVDFLAKLVPIFNWAYLPRIQHREELANPLLSTTFLPAASLPPYVFFLACELDLLAMGAYKMASRLAGRPEPTVAVQGKETISEEGELIPDDERFYFEKNEPGSSYRWLLVPDVVHSFDIRLNRVARGDKPMFADAEKKTQKCQDMIAEWLFSGPFAE